MAPSGVLIAELLGLAAITIRRRAHVMDVDVALLVDVAEDLGKAGEDRLDVALLLILGVGLVCDLDLQREARLAMALKRPAGDDPVAWIDT